MNGRVGPQKKLQQKSKKIGLVSNAITRWRRTFAATRTKTIAMTAAIQSDFAIT